MPEDICHPHLFLHKVAEINPAQKTDYKITTETKDPVTKSTVSQTDIIDIDPDTTRPSSNTTPITVSGIGGRFTYKPNTSFTFSEHIETALRSLQKGGYLRDWVVGELTDYKFVNRIDEHLPQHFRFNHNLDILNYVQTTRLHL